MDDLHKLDLLSLQLKLKRATDKSSIHSYLPLYEQILKTRRLSATHVMELGVYLGGSCELWTDYFPNAHVTGVDVPGCDYTPAALQTFERIGSRGELLLQDGAYCEQFIQQQLAGDIRYDMILDDGTHRLDHLLFVVEHYPQLLKPDGVLIIEDVQDKRWFESMIEHTPVFDRQHVQTYDRTHLRGERHSGYHAVSDDLIYVLDRRTTGPVQDLALAPQ